MEIHTWLANPDELNRIPALRQYAATAQRALNVSAAGDAMEKLFEQLPGVAEKMRVLTDEVARNAGSLTVKTQAALYIPKGDPNAPMLTMTTDLAEISSDPIDDSVFAVPAGFPTGTACGTRQGIDTSAGGTGGAAAGTSADSTWPADRQRGPRLSSTSATRSIRRKHAEPDWRGL